MNPPAVVFPFALVLAAASPAQSWSWQLDPRATFLRTSNDAPAPPLVLDLTALGTPPGTWLRVGTAGAYRYINGGQDTHRSLVGVFSSSSQLLATGLQNRVPGAIAAGGAFSGGATYYGSLAMDIAEDFFASRPTWADHVVVRVPPGATHLFLGTFDSWYQDNVDPNGDFRAELAVENAPTLPGTAEHLVLRAAAAGPAIGWPDVHAAPASSTLVAEIEQPVGFASAAVYAIVGETVPTGIPPQQSLPWLWLATPIVLAIGVVPDTPGWTDAWSVVVPPGLAGTTVVVQGGALLALARNGFYETTNAHCFLLQ